MSIDIANMIVNIKEAQNFDWGNLLTAIIGAFATLLAAFFGAEFAFKRNAEWEKQKKAEIDKQNFKRLYYMTSDVLSTALADRKNIIDDIRKQVERFNKTVKIQGELIDYFDKREYKSFEEFEKDGKLKENIVKVIEALNKNSNILICLTYALMTILDSYRLKTMQNEEFVNIKIDQKQVNAILKDPETLKDIPEDIKEGFSFFTNKQNNICPESSIVM